MLVRRLQAVTRVRSGWAEIATLTVLYGFYELVRGARQIDMPAAMRHAREIVDLERSLHVFAEGSVQHLSERLAPLADLLAFAYPVLHFAVSISVLWWVYHSHRSAFPAVRTTLIVTTLVGLAGYLLYPVAPPRIAVPGLVDTVSRDTPLDLGSTLVGRFYNPVAAVPSLHVAYAVLFGAALLVLARPSAIRVAGALYPVVVVIVVIATGNHFFFDAATGAAAAALGACTTWLLWSASRYTLRRERSSAVLRRSAPTGGLRHP